MGTVEDAYATQMNNIQIRTGTSLDDLYAIIGESGLVKHGQIRDMLKQELAMGHGDANTLVHAYQQSLAAAPGTADAGSGAKDTVLAEIYAGAKADLRPIHDRLMAVISPLGEFEIAPKKGYVSLRRKKQFAMIGPATKTRVDVGLNVKGIPPTERLVQLPAGGMCQYRVSVTDPAAVDAELAGWIKQAYDAAG